MRRFISPEQYAARQRSNLTTGRGDLIFAYCKSGKYMAKQVAEAYNSLLKKNGSKYRIRLLDMGSEKFADSEFNITLNETVRNADIYLFQSLYNPTKEDSINDHYMELFITARAMKENQANSVTAILPYLAYARQDKPTKFRRQATTAKLLADLSKKAGIDHLVVWDPHSPQLKGFYEFPTEMLESLSFFIDHFKKFKGRKDVIAVAPDAGATKTVVPFARALHISFGIAEKYRPKPNETETLGLTGNFKDKKIAIIIDDMIDTGSTFFNVIRELHANGIREIYGGCSHTLLNGPALALFDEAHAKYGFKTLLTTNSIPQKMEVRKRKYIHEVSLAETFALVINRIHYGQSLSSLFYMPHN